MFLLTDLAVMVTSGLEVASRWPISSMDLDLAAAANTSAMLLLKVNGMAEELEVSPLLLKSWLLLDLEPAATKGVLPKVGPFCFCFCFSVGSFRSCIKLALFDLLRSLFTWDAIADN